MGAARATNGGAHTAPVGELSADTRQRLLDAAIELFLAHGYHRLRIEDITNLAGVAKGTFYLYFENKRELLLVYFQYVHGLIDAVEAEAADTSLDYLQRVGIRMRSALEPGGNWHKTMTFLRISANSDDPEIAAAARGVHLRMSEAAKKDMVWAIEHGIVRRVDPYLATLAWAGIQETLAWRADQDGAYDHETIIACVLDLFSHAFLCDPDASTKSRPDPADTPAKT